MVANRYPGKCRLCGTEVKASQGKLIGKVGSWGIECSVCTPPKPHATKRNLGVSAKPNLVGGPCEFCGIYIGPNNGVLVDTSNFNSKSRMANRIRARGDRYGVVCRELSDCKLRSAEAASFENLNGADTKYQSISEALSRVTEHLEGYDCVGTEHEMIIGLLDGAMTDLIYDNNGLKGETRVILYVLQDGRPAAAYRNLRKRDLYYVPRDLALAVLQATIDYSISMGEQYYLPEVARAWLLKNERCEGTDLYRLACGLDPWAPGYLVK